MNGEGGGVPHENISVHEVPLDMMHTWLEEKSKTCVLIGQKFYAGIYLIGWNQ